MQIIVCKLVHLLPVNGNKATKPRQCFIASTGKTKMLQQAVRIMKLTAVIILAACLQVTAAGYGQKISLTEKDSPIEKVLKKIQQQTSYRFLYTSQLLEGTPKVSIAVKNASIEEVLDMCFKGQKLDYEINENTIIIRPRREVAGGVSPVKVEGPIDVRGVITDENGAPAQGVNITVKGTNRGTTTNLRGEFVLNGVDENAVLLISSVGYDRQEISVKGKSLITMQMRVAVGNLDEMQVIAYGKTSKRFQTGNIVTVKASDIEKQPVNNPLLALEGRVPGLFVTQNTGIAGGGVTVRIQGQNSIQSGNDPLYVVDGVPVISQLTRTGIDQILGNSGDLNASGSALSYINPSDIESIEVLKDADATAIYGSRAANGAILITTKKGRSGPVRIDLNMQTGWGNVAREFDMLHTREYLNMRKEAKLNDGLAVRSTDYDINGTWDTTRYSNWQKALIGNTANYTNLNASVAGGSNTIQYLVGITYHKETTVFPFPSDFNDRKGAIHLNLNSTSANQKFRIQFSSNYMIDKNTLPNTDLTQKAIQLEPNAPALYNEDGSINWAPTSTGISSWSNPLVPMLNRYENKTANLIDNLMVGYKILPSLEISSSMGYTNMQTDDYQANPLVAIRPERRPSNQRVALYGNRNINSWIIEPQVKYNRSIGSGVLDLMLGNTFLQSNSKGGNVYGIGYTSDDVLKNIQAASTVGVGASFVTKYKYYAMFGRANYNWKNKYIINITTRRDGSSRFGAANRFQNFWAVGGAWLFSEEQFMQRSSSFLSFGKLRASYGTTGNDQIGDYSFLSLYNVVDNNGVPYQNTTGSAPAGLPNPHLQWEETRKLQIGISLGIIKDRILMDFTYSRNRSSNQLTPYALPTITGFQSVTRNFPATIQNTSWEFTVNTINFHTAEFNWTSSVNLTIPQNKLIAFPDLASSSYAQDLIVGQPLGVIKVFNLTGVDPATGMYAFLDSQGKSTITPDYSADRTVIINPFPKFYGGLQNTLSYKGFQLDFFLQFIKQKGVQFTFYNGFRFPGEFPNGFSNQPVTVLDRWQKPTDVASIAKYSSVNRYFDATTSNYIYGDASYIRLRNISLSWQLPEKWKKKAHLQNCRLYTQCQNALTITSYKGLDPENRDIRSLPPLRVWATGLQLGL